jgi:transcriptional regulator with XRE-family HTH domain
MHRLERPSVPAELAAYQPPGTLEPATSGLGSLIHRGRSRAGLTLAQAARLAGTVAQAVGDQRYAIAPSTLSDYEGQTVPPRHLEKVMTLCLIYGIPLIDFVRAEGFAPEHLGQHPMPRALLPERPTSCPPLPRPGSPSSEAASASLLRAFGTLPWFLSGSVSGISGIPHPSLRDCFWLTGDQPYLPAYTEGSMLALVDRRRKTPLRIPSLPAWFQPAYLLMMRDGQYRCACCSVEEEHLFLYPRPGSRRVPEKLLPGRDVEVIGQVIALARRIG